MDSLQWISINPKIKIIPTTKKFYRKYLYKLTYNLSGAYYLSNCKTIAQMLNRVQNRKFSLSTKQLEQLLVFYNLYNDKSNNLRWRCEGGSVSIFGETEQQIFNCASVLLKTYINNLISVTKVASNEDKDILESGRIIVKQKTDFKYKITIREGFKLKQDRLYLANYISSIREEVKITDFLLEAMLSQDKYLHGCYFYVNDLKIVDMIALIAPKIVRQVQEVVVR